jgi:hypothetical protein
LVALIGSVLPAAAIAQDTTVVSPSDTTAVANPPPTTTNPIITNPGSPQPEKPTLPPKPRRSRVISADVAAQLSAGLPKYTPPPPKPPPEDDDVDMRDIDKPKNGIIRLPKYVVHEKPPPVLTERAVNTQKGLADLAMKRYISPAYRVLNPFTLPLFGSTPEQVALAMYGEDERLKNMSDLSEAARLVGSTDKAAGQYVKRQVDQTFMRDGDFDWKPIGR